MNELRRAADKNSCNKFEMTSKKIIYDGFLLILVISALFFNNSKGNAQVYGQNGMVVSSNILASQVGIDILKKGGNAIDASVATAFALAVTHPQAGNIGGGGFLVFMNAAGEATTIDFREKEKPHMIPKELIMKEARTGKAFYFGSDKAGRSIIIIHPALQEMPIDEEGVFFWGHGHRFAFPDDILG
jgi:hypothetical protein